MNINKILVVDDDKEIVESIGIFLRAEGYEVEKAYDGLQALEKLMAMEVQLIILDVMMPKMDGMNTLLKIREHKNIPVILLSAKSEDADKILGLTAGADDYVTKPFNSAELVARVKSQLRRYTKLGSMVETRQQDVITYQGLSFNKEKKCLTLDGEPVKLTPLEYKIVELLITNIGRVFSAEEIYERVWNEDAYASENTVAVHVRRIREKIEITPNDPRYLKVVWGIGYKLGD